MQNTKLACTLRCLTRPEFLRLADFLDSPFFNKEPKVAELHRSLRPYHPDFNARGLNEEKIFARLYPKSAFSQQMLRNLMSKLLRLTEQYLVQLQLEKQPVEQGKLLLQTLSERAECSQFFFKKAEKMQRQLEGQKTETAEKHLELFRLEKLIFDHPMTPKFKLPSQRLDLAMGHLDRYFLLEKLLLGCEMKTRERILLESHQIALWDESLLAARSLAGASTLLPALSDMTAVTVSNDKGAFYRLKKTLLDDHPELPHRFKQDLLGVLVNFAVRLGNTGHTEFQKENFELYRLGLPLGLLHADGILSDMVFLNIVKMASKLGKFDWCGRFIEAHAHELPPNCSDTVASLARANLLLKMGRPGAATELLERVGSVNDFYKLDWRGMLLKCRYEHAMKDRSLLPVVIAEATAFEKLMTRNRKIAGTHADKHRRFAANVRLLATARWEGQPYGREQLQAKFGPPEQSASWLWLMEKLDKK